MILLDTNVLSALMNDKPDPAVIRWLDGLAPDEVWTTVITIFEVRFGLHRLAFGRKRQRLESAFNALIDQDLMGRIVPVDRAAADAAGVLAARREAAGRPVDVRDTLIAGIAIARRAAIATRNTRHFADLNIRMVDPWSA